MKTQKKNTKKNSRNKTSINRTNKKQHQQMKFAKNTIQNLKMKKNRKRKNLIKSLHANTRVNENQSFAHNYQ